MAYTSINFKTKKAFKEAVANGTPVTCFAPGLGSVPYNGTTCIEGPWAPAAHTWYAEVAIKDGYVVKVK